MNLLAISHTGTGDKSLDDGYTHFMENFTRSKYAHSEQMPNGPEFTGRCESPECNCHTFIFGIGLQQLVSARIGSAGCNSQLSRSKLAFLIRKFLSHSLSVK